jgi:hypothetical protein
MQIDQPTLIQPTEVVVSDAVFVDANPILTPLGESPGPGTRKFCMRVIDVLCSAGFSHTCY